jgi:hypothetical protein
MTGKYCSYFRFYQGFIPAKKEKAVFLPVLDFLAYYLYNN